MEDEKETEKLDEYEKDKQAEERPTSFIHLHYSATDSLQTFRNLPCCSRTDDLLSVFTFCKKHTAKEQSTAYKTRKECFHSYSMWLALLMGLP